jgi:chromosome segregation ATPase
MVIETEVFKVRSAQMKQIFDVNDKKMAHLVQVIEKQKICISDLEETLFQKQQQIQVMEESRGKAESDLTDVKENLNQRYLEFHELQLQLKMCQEQLTEAPMALEAEHASRAELQKQDSNMDSQLSEVSNILVLFNIRFSM